MESDLACTVLPALRNPDRRFGAATIQVLVQRPTEQITPLCVVGTMPRPAGAS